MNVKKPRRIVWPAERRGTLPSLILLGTLGMGVCPLALCLRFDLTSSPAPIRSGFSAISTATVSERPISSGDTNFSQFQAKGSDSASNPSALGTIRGTVRIENKIQPRSIAFNLYSRRGKSPLINKPPVPVSELQNVVLYLEGRSQNLEAASNEGLPQENPTIQQVNETFIPHVLPIRVGTTVDFPNGDPFFHNVFSLSSARSFDLGRYPKYQVRSVTFKRPGIIKVFCHIHSHMSAVILVFDHPYFSVANSAGSFRLRDVPPGTYDLVAWHERLKPQKKSVTIAPGAGVQVEMIL